MREIEIDDIDKAERENNVQNSKDMAKPYQVRDFLKLVENYKLDFKE